MIGTVGSEAKADHARAAGMQEAVFYKTESVPERIKALTQGRGADVIIDMDFSTTARWAAEGALAPHGQVVCYGSNALDVNLPFRPWLFQSMGVKFFLVYDLTPADRKIAVSRLSDMLANHQLQHCIGARFPLAQMAEAHRTVEVRGGRVEAHPEVLHDLGPPQLLHVGREQQRRRGGSRDGLGGHRGTRAYLPRCLSKKRANVSAARPYEPASRA